MVDWHSFLRSLEQPVAALLLCSRKMLIGR
jgi:hypothetical protein